jgi:hypothetical protein
MAELVEFMYTHPWQFIINFLALGTFFGLMIYDIFGNRK